jgi:hypothetical protein
MMLDEGVFSDRGMVIIEGVQRKRDAALGQYQRVLQSESEDPHALAWLLGDLTAFEAQIEALRKQIQKSLTGEDAASAA